jgi:hypothetical protein
MLGGALCQLIGWSCAGQCRASIGLAFFTFIGWEKNEKSLQAKPASS